MFSVAWNETFRELGNHPLVKQMRDDGVEMPRTQEEFDAMRKDAPYWAGKWENLFSTRFHKAHAEVRNYHAALQSQEADSTKGLQDGINRFAAFVNKNVGIEYDEKQKEALVAELKNIKGAYEDRHGVPILSEERVYKTLLAEKFPDLLEEIRLKEQQNGRVQAASHMKSIREKQPSTISTNRVPGSKGKQKPKVDVDDREAVVGLGDEEIEKRLQQGKTGE